jgi:hypothetical protein
LTIENTGDRCESRIDIFAEHARGLPAHDDVTNEGLGLVEERTRGLAIRFLQRPQFSRKQGGHHEVLRARQHELTDESTQRCLRIGPARRAASISTRPRAS